MVNMTPLYLGMHHSSIADWLGLSLARFRLLHREMAMMTMLMSLIHSIVMTTSASTFTWTDSTQVHGVAVRRPPSRHPLIDADDV